jgi:hypothetical protein
VSIFSRRIYYAVHGVRPAERRLRRRSYAKRGPARDWKYLAWVRSLPCLVCGRAPAEAAHTGSDGGLRQKSSDYSCVPLCREHHTMASRSYHAGSRAEFERRHGIDLAVVVENLNAEFWEGQK